MTEAQRNEIQAQLMAIGQINAALQAGTDSGLFDEMAACVSHPDLINTFCDDMAKMTACSMTPFKLTVAGFDSADNETDDRVFFVSAPNAQVVKACIQRTGSTFIEHVDLVISIDFNLHFQSDALRSALLKFGEAQPAKPLAIIIDPIATHPKIFLETHWATRLRTTLWRMGCGSGSPPQMLTARFHRPAMHSKALGMMQSASRWV